MKKGILSGLLAGGLVFLASGRAATQYANYTIWSTPSQTSDWVISTTVNMSFGPLQGFGLYSAGSQVIMTGNITIGTQGTQSDGLRLNNNGSRIETGDNLIITTSGYSADGINASNTASSTVIVGDNAHITTTKSSLLFGTVGYEGSHAVRANNSQYANGLNIITIGDNAILSTGGNNSYAVLAGLGYQEMNTGTISRTGSSKVIIGENALIQTGTYNNTVTGTLNTLTGTSTASSNAYAVHANQLNSEIIIGNNATVYTTGATSHALYATNAGHIEMLGDTTIALDKQNTANAVLAGQDAEVIFARDKATLNIIGKIRADNSKLSDSTKDTGTVSLSGSGGVVRMSAGGSSLIQRTDDPNNVILESVNGGQIVVDAYDQTQIIGNISVSGSSANGDASVVTLSLNDQAQLTGATTTSGVLTINMDGAGSLWSMTSGTSTVDHLNMLNNGQVKLGTDDDTSHLIINQNLTGNGVFSMNTNVEIGEGDLITVSGSAEGSHRILIHDASNPNGTESPLLLVETGGGNGVFSGTTGIGMFNYTVQSGSSLGLVNENWYLAQMQDSGTDTPQVNPGGSNVLTAAAAQSMAWLTQMDTLNKRMGELRLNHATGQSKLTGGWLENAWVRSYGQQVNFGSKVSGTPYREQLYGVDLETDKAWQLDAENLLYTGVFIGYGNSDRDLRNSFGSNGNTDSYYSGFYGTWLHDSGWYADLVGKAQYFDNSFESWDASGNTTTGDYDNWGLGVSLEVGRQFQFKDGWFVEPQAQMSYVHFTNANYQTGGDNRFAVSLGDADVVQFRGGLVMGRTIRFEKSKSILQPYIKVNGVEQISSGGYVRADGGAWRPNLDGARAEIGAGLVWQIDDQNQLHLDYEAAFADKYDKPWGVNFGFRHQF
ncbi:MAG: autotransporter outer membrane beta-barrel domain-containing protein [Verrucomicrobiales bacterium]|nr:autotransporter outer membrane beta-barrel domain-containing protein [Verrucomicrobiales bacterium]